MVVVSQAKEAAAVQTKGGTVARVLVVGRAAAKAKAKGRSQCLIRERKDLHHEAIVTAVTLRGTYGSNAIRDRPM